MRQIRKAKAVRSAPTSIRKDGWKVAFHLPDGLAYDLEGLAAAARQITYKTGRMGNPHLDFLAKIERKKSYRISFMKMNPLAFFLTTLARRPKFGFSVRPVLYVICLAAAASPSRS